MSGEEPDGGDSDTEGASGSTDAPESAKAGVPLEELAGRLPIDRRTVPEDPEGHDPERGEGDAADRVGPDPRVPLSELAGDVRKRRDRTGQDGSPFQEIDVGSLDSEDAWEQLLSTGETADGDLSVGAGASPGEIDPVPGQNEHVVPKEEFCSRCPHLSAPPAVQCKHDGTEIMEVTDAEHFRVRNCPFVENLDAELAAFD